MFLVGFRVQEKNCLNCLKLIKVYNHPLIYPLLCPKVLAEKLHYWMKILRETDFIDLVSCIGWSMALRKKSLLKFMKN